jgi:hypothetical protein
MKKSVDKGAKPDTIAKDRNASVRCEAKGDPKIIALLESYMPSWILVSGMYD